ncbi:MAG: hypothetical protein JXQ90_01755 [Cyclobacteriaceae bacterium]
MKPFVLSTIALVLLLSCSEEALLDNKADRVSGMWVFKEAKYHDYNRVFANDLNREYDGDIIELDFDFYAVYTDFELKEAFEGSWGIYLETDEYEDIYFVEMTFYDPVVEEEFGYYAEIEMVTNNKMNLIARNTNGEYRFKLLRL